MLTELFGVLSTTQLFHIDIDKERFPFKCLWCFQCLVTPAARSMDFAVSSNRNVSCVRAKLNAVFPLDGEQHLVCFASEPFCYSEYFNLIELDRVLKTLRQF